MMFRPSNIGKTLAAALLSILAAGGLGALDLTQIYFSGLNPDQSLDVLVNASATGEFCYIGADQSVQTAPSQTYLDQEGWQEGHLAQPAHPWLGFRMGSPATLVDPIYFTEAGGNIVHTKFCPLEADPLGDQTVGAAYLDILGTKIAFSDQRFYYSIRNNSNTFPVSSGVTFFSYMGILIDPNAPPEPAPIVFGLMYTVDVAGIMSPGLYKITGTGISDLTLIGEIETSIDEDNGTLTLSCALSDLMDDPDFSSWFNPEYPLVATQAMTSRISLTGGVTTSDTTAGTDVLLKPQALDYDNLYAPQITDPFFIWDGWYLTMQVSYSDADHNLAQAIGFSIDGGAVNPFFPIQLDGFGGPVLFCSAPVACSEAWDEIVVSVVNAGITYEYTFENTANADPQGVSAPLLILCPEEASGDFSYVLAKLVPGEKIALFNQRGQLLKKWLPNAREGMIGTKELPAGRYFVRYAGAASRFWKL